MKRGSNSIFLVILLLIVIVLTIQFRAGAPQPERLSFNELADALNNGNVSRLIVDETEVEVMFTDGSIALALKEGSRTLVEQLLELGVSEEMLSSERVRIEVTQPGLLSTSNLIPLLVAGAAGTVLGAALVLLAIRAGYFAHD